MALLGGLGISLWRVALAVPAGRARARDFATPGQLEAAFNRLYELSRAAPFEVESATAPQFRRVVLQRRVSERRVAEGGRRAAPLVPGSGFAAGGEGMDGAGKGAGGGRGSLFVGHTGEIRPSASLPLGAGNVRTHDLADAYREGEPFRALRDPRTSCGASAAPASSGRCAAARGGAPSP